MKININEFFKWSLQSLEAIIYIGLIMATIVMTFVITIPRIQATYTEQTKIVNLKLQSERLDNQLQAIDLLGQEDFPNRIILLNQILPSKHNIPYLINIVKQIAQETNVTIEDTSANFPYVQKPKDDKDSETPKEPTPELIPQELNLSISGSPSDIVQFMKQLNNASPLMYVKQFASDTKKNEIIQLKITVESYVYTFPNVKSEPSDIPQLPKFSAKDKQLYQDLMTLHHYEFAPTTITQPEDPVDPFHPE